MGAMKMIGWPMVLITAMTVAAMYRLPECLRIAGQDLSGEDMSRAILVSMNTRLLLEMKKEIGSAHAADHQAIIRIGWLGERFEDNMQVLLAGGEFNGTGRRMTVQKPDGHVRDDLFDLITAWEGAMWLPQSIGQEPVWISKPVRIGNCLDSISIINPHLKHKLNLLDQRCELLFRMHQELLQDLITPLPAGKLAFLPTRPEKLPVTGDRETQPDASLIDFYLEK